MSLDYDDAHLAAIYDHDNPSGADHAFFCALADEIGARSIVDLGCGTGLLTVLLAQPAQDARPQEEEGRAERRRIVGIDPAQAMLDVALTKPNAQAVEWVCGTSREMAPGSAVLVLMTGNVAMHILLEEWHETLAHIAAVLVPGGTLSFESRNPEAQAWLGWNEAPGERDTPAGRLQESLQTTPPDANGVVVMHIENRFLADGHDVPLQQGLQFRSYEQIVADLQQAGLEVAACYRDWQRAPFTGGAEQPLMVFVAKKPLQ